MAGLVRLAYSIYYAERRKADRSAIRARVEEAGGRVLAFKLPGMLVRSPFAPLGNHPLYFKVEVEHGERRGLWYVRTTIDQPSGDWVWCDEAQAESLPVDWPDARVDNSVFELGVVLGVAIYLGVIGSFVWFIFWLYGFK